MTHISPALPASPAARTILSLDGIWDFSFEGRSARLEGSGHKVKVPGIWQAQFEALRNSSGTGTYRRQIDVPPLAEGQRLVLVLAGVFHRARISLDGQPVGYHDNAWTPVELDITEAARCKQALDLAVAAEVPDESRYSSDSLGTLLHAKQDWYGLQGGIWNSVWLEVRDAVHFASLAVQAQTDGASHTVRITGRLSAGERGEIEIAVRRGDRIVARAAAMAQGADITAELELAEIELWSPETPNLYDVDVSLRVGGRLADHQSRGVGFRRFEARDGRLLLNGEPFYMLGALDQDWYPETECLPPDAAFLEQRFRRAKALGLNTLRCHVKIPDPLYFELADRLGLIVWLDMPYMEFLAPATRAQLVETFKTAVRDHAHHPSICIWTIINEGWGIDLDDNPDDRAWLKTTFDGLKPLVSGSLLIDNSPCFPRNYHVKTDIEDFHWYNSWPSQNDQFQSTTDAFAGRPAWSFSPHGDGARRGNEPLIVSEFGVWGLPHPHELREADGSEPWWFESGHDWNQGAGYPHGIETRFRDAGLAPIFGDVDGFVSAAQGTQFRGLKHQIETLRYAEPISGYVITELNDTQWEANGLMDARNNLREFGGKLAALQQPWLMIARAKRTALRPGEAMAIEARLSGAGPAPDGATLRWHFGGQSGLLPLRPGPSGSLELRFDIHAGSDEPLSVCSLSLEARDAADQALSTNSLEFCIAPMPSDMPPLLPLDGPSAELLARLGWANISDAPEATLLATRLTLAVREALIAGRKVLLIANDLDALREPERSLPERDLVNFPKMEIRTREGTFWDGRWMGAFTWRRTDGPWSDLPNGPMLDEHWGAILPKYVLTGFRSTAFHGLVDAGVAVAWLHKAAAFSKRSFLGKGWITVSTFDLTSADAAANPLALHVLAALARS